MSKSIAFIGIGNMGCPMAENLMKSGKAVKVFDVSNDKIKIAKEKNLEVIYNLDELINSDVDTVITMLPEGKHSKDKSCEEGILKGMYKIKEFSKNKKTKIQFLGSGTILREMIAGAEILQNEYQIDSEIWSVTSFNELRRDDKNRSH